MTSPDSTPPPWAWLLPCCIAAVLGLWVALQSGFLADDWVHILAQNGQHPTAGPGDLYRWAIGDPQTLRAQQEMGLAPWWATPGLKIAFLRPLSSALTALDLALFGVRAELHFVHSWLWSLASVAVMQRLFRRLLPPWAALLAAVLFAVAPSQSAALGWLAGRSGLVATTLGGCGVLAAMRGRIGGSILGLTAALLAGEAGLAWCAYTAVWWLIAAPAKRRAVGLASVGALVAIYGAAYLLLDYGTVQSGAYVSPASESLRWLWIAPWRSCIAAAVLLAGFPADWAFRSPDSAILIGLGATVAALIAGWTGSTLRKGAAPARAGILVLALGAVGATIPMLSGPLGPWSYVAPTAGASGVLAWLIADAAASSGGLRWVRRTAAVTLMAVHGLGGAATFAVTGAVLGGLQSRTKTEAAFLASDPRPTLILTAPDAFTAMYGAARQRVVHPQAPPEWLVASLSPTAHRLERTGARTLRLSLQGHLFDTAFSRISAAPGPSPPQPTRLLGAEFTAIPSESGALQRVQIHLNKPLSNYRLVAWHRSEWVEIQAPEPGQSTTIEWRPPPMW
ncbi:MAG: hypothetical protein AB8H79_12500 [Myxococcota bacterium]